VNESSHYSSVRSWISLPESSPADGTDSHENREFDAEQPLLDNSSGHDAIPSSSISTTPPSLSSTLTIRANQATEPEPDIPTDSSLTIETYRTASSSLLSQPSIAAATEGGSTIHTSPSVLVHRFTLIKPGMKRNSSAGGSTAEAERHPSPLPSSSSWNPFDFLFMSSGRSLGAKCDLCLKRLGWKPVLECDDCGLRAHLKCGELAPLDCGTRIFRAPPTSITSTPGRSKVAYKIPGSFSAPFP